MTSTIRTAAFALAAGASILSACRASVSVPNAVSAAEAAPVVFAQLEIRGLDAFFDTVDRIAAPYAPAGQAKAMLTGMGGASLGVNPFDLIDGNGTVRVVVYGVDNDMDVLLDFPAAGGDVSGVLGKLEGFLPAAAVPDGVALPEGALSLHDGNFAPAVFIPRGERIVLVPHSAFEHDIRDTAGVLAVLDSAPSLPAAGAWAAAIDFDAVRTCISSDKTGGPGTQLLDMLDQADFPVRSIAFGLGLDGTDRLRGDFSVELRPGTPHARMAESFGTPASPMANAILFPDALAAASCRQVTSVFDDGELRDFFGRQFDANFLAVSLAADDDGAPLPAEVRTALVSAYMALFRLLGDEWAFVFLPGENGEEGGSAGILAFPENPAAVLDALPERFAETVSAFAEAVNAAAGDGNEVDGEVLPRLELRGELELRSRTPPADGQDAEPRTVQVKRYALRGGGAGQDAASDSGSFEAAAVGTALYLGSLPGERRDRLLDELAAGKTGKGPVASMPAFADAYGDAPADAACGFVRLRPALRALLPRIKAFAEAVGDDGSAFDPAFSNAISAFASAPGLPDITLALSQRWIPGDGRFSTVLSVPLADLHAAMAAIAGLQRRAVAAPTARRPARSPAPRSLGNRHGEGK